MPQSIVVQLVAGLMLWALASLGSATIALYARPGDFWRHFWFMTAMWGWVDGGIAWAASIRPLPSPASLVPALRFNSGLDVVYVAVAGFLMTRKTARPRGFGLAVLFQGLFLLGFDLYFWWKCAATAG